MGSNSKADAKLPQPQLFACLILKAITGATYRRTEEMLALMPAVRESIGLGAVPRFTTLQTFADRPDVLALKELEVENARLKKAVADLTIDNQILKEANDYLGKPRAPRGGGAS